MVSRGVALDNANVDPFLLCAERGPHDPWSVRFQPDKRSLYRLGKVSLNVCCILLPTPNLCGHLDCLPGSVHGFDMPCTDGGCGPGVNDGLRP
ncbi:hypothetical protein DPMN_074866 [Dreissena polymorpha]|uniref:Uncharacterized protein n=1 Tax=Dreissena polymorpha TaxID=45954 RepID=A0A9D4BL11_DREPO|nr:hypothetical protein DPMN_074866 [Dreissena polymorpha]